MSPVSIFDIDGTVSDDRWRRHLIDGFDRFARYHRAAPADKPINQQLVIDRQMAGDDIYFATSRPIMFYAQTHAWLRRELDMSYFVLMMRADEDYRTSPEVRLTQVKNVAELRDVSVVYDDRPEMANKPVETIDAGNGVKYCHLGDSIAEFNRRIENLPPWLRNVALHWSKPR